VSLPTTRGLVMPSLATWGLGVAWLLGIETAG